MPMILVRLHHRLIFLGVTHAAIAGAGLAGSIQTIAALSATQLSGAQVRLTKIGLPTKTLSSLAFTTFDSQVNMDRFRPFYEASDPYAGDRIAKVRFAVTTQEMKSLVDSVAADTSLGTGIGDATPGLSFAIVAGPDSQTVHYELLVSEARAKRLFSRLLSGLRTNSTAMARISEFGCALGMLALAPPTLFDGKVSAELRGVRRLGATGWYLGRVIVTNTSESSISAPLGIGLVMSGRVTLLDPDGRTCAVDPSLMPYRTLPTNITLDPGQSIECKVTFRNPGNEPVIARLIRVFDVSGSK